MILHCIKGKRIRKFNLPKEYDISKIQIGIPVTENEGKRVGLTENGDVILPSGVFGPQSRKNAYGFTYADKSKPKERRYVSTTWIYPFGNSNASIVAIDINRECYPKKVVPPYGIELQLCENQKGQQFVLANLTNEIREKFLKVVINIFLEIFGVCYIYDSVVQINDSVRKRRCNWEILPPGKMPSRHIENQLRENGERADTYNIYRLKCIEKYKPELIVEGINGFKGYFAYVFKNYCVLESVVYGNATYIIPKENWEILSQKTKRELLNEKKIIGKIDHTGKWQHNITNKFYELGINY